MAQLPPPVHGAALRNLSLLNSEMINNKFEVHSLPLKFIDNMKDLGKFSFRKIFLMIKYSLDLSRILLTRKIDLVYFTMSPSGGAFYRDILFITIIKLFRKNRVLHFRVKGIKKTSESMLGRMLVKYAFRGSEIVCLSKHHMLDVEGLTTNPPFHVPNGIKVETEFLHLVNDNNTPDGCTAKILFLSNLSRKKGVPELIDALSDLNTRGYKFSASLVGSEWDMSFGDVNKLIRNAGLKDMVTVEGPKFGKEKFTFIAQSDIFVFPTYFELFPGVVLEAMMFGKAIVSTLEGSIPEMIDHGINGILTEQRNVKQLADGIAFLIDNPEIRKKMSKQARDKFFKEFTLESFEKKMLAVFEQSINKPNSVKLLQHE